MASLNNLNKMFLLCDYCWALEWTDVIIINVTRLFWKR